MSSTAIIASRYGGTHGPAEDVRVRAHLQQILQLRWQPMKPPAQEKPLDSEPTTSALS